MRLIPGCLGSLCGRCSPMGRSRGWASMGARCINMHDFLLLHKRWQKSMFWFKTKHKPQNKCSILQHQVIIILQHSVIYLSVCRSSTRWTWRPRGCVNQTTVLRTSTMSCCSAGAPNLRTDRPSSPSETSCSR